MPAMTSRSQPETPWLSVAMPVHHGERWLSHTLDSLGAQDCSGVEFIIMDSTAGDSCGEIVRRYTDRLDIHYEHVPDVKSWPAKTNLAVDRAAAAHVAMLHQDDLWEPQRTKAAREAIAAAPDAVLLLNPSRIVDERGRHLGMWRCPLPANCLLDGRKVAERLLIQNFVAIPAPIIQKRAWLECGGMDEALWYTADWDLYLKLLAAGPVFYRNTPTTAFRVHGSSLTVSGSRDRSDFRQQMQEVLDRHSNLVPPSELPRVRRRANASIVVNCALAQASSGSARALLHALVEVLSLGPAQALRYVRDSRILERALPRLRARLAGSF
jgi:glycosyltransferase involved in cell wall biosynthesis